MPSETYKKPLTLSAFMLSVVTLSVLMLNVVMVSVVMLSVVEPKLKFNKPQVFINNTSFPLELMNLPNEMECLSVVRLSSSG